MAYLSNGLYELRIKELQNFLIQRRVVDERREEPILEGDLTYSELSFFKRIRTILI